MKNFSAFAILALGVWLSACTVEEPKWVGWLRDLENVLDEYDYLNSYEDIGPVTEIKTSENSNKIKMLGELRKQIETQLSLYTNVLADVAEGQKEKFLNGYELIKSHADNVLYPWRRWVQYYNKITFAVAGMANNPELLEQFAAAVSEWKRLDAQTGDMLKTIPEKDKPEFLAAVVSNRAMLEKIIPAE
ncbi:MAG: hypothetical protein A2Y33_11995 [Spirochaetes bacterium GWF1_51_8]|nr:MAG: hypothetical protein A2Y33_11995 [Spirochaetes bacterium GWF1_51_8]